MTPPIHRAGFSLVEALVVLAISGMALAIIFSIGVKAGDTGFSLGRRAMSAADVDIAASDLRSILRSFALRPSLLFLDGVDEPILGTANRLEGDVVMERATQCAPLGWSGRLMLEIEPDGAGQSLTCSANGKKVTLLTTRGDNASLTYSRDGQVWTRAYTNKIENRSEEALPRSDKVWVRFAARPEVDIVDLIESSRPELWRRPDAIE